MDRSKENYKTSLCRHYMSKGVCSLYEKCYFAHGNQDLRRKTDPLPGYLPSPLRPVSIYKTQLCKYFMNGYCRNDDKCPFAHGSVDLHSMLVESTGVAPPIMTPIMTPLPTSLPTSIRVPMMTPIRPPMMAPPPSAPANLKPDYGQAGEFLCSILRNLEQVFPQAEVKQHILLKKGLQLIESGDLPQVNEIINEIVSSTCLSEKQREACQTILSNAYSLHRITFLNF